MPIERLRMRPWLENALNEHKFPGVEWVSEEDKIFRLPWKHASRNGWQINTDASLFRAWAVHTGKYKSNEKPNPKTWKANFRCALNSLPDMEELTDRRTTKGNNAFKVYRIMNSTVKKGYTSKKMKGRAQRKKRQLYRARSIQKQFQPKNNNNTESAQSCESNCMEDDTTTSFPQEMNGTHLVDHDYAVTRYFDIFNETTDDNMQEVFDDSDRKRVKTEPLSPQEIRVDDDYSLYDESAVDTKNIKTSCTKEDDKIMSDDEVVELIDELSSDNGSCTSVDAAMDELLVDIDPFENCFSSEKSKQRATSAPGMLQPSLDIFCPQPSKALRSKSSSDIQTMSSLTHEEFLLQVVSGKFEG